MRDPITAILLENLTEAMRQLNTYLPVGLAAAVSAFVLSRPLAKQKEDGEGIERSGEACPDNVTLPGGFVSMHPGIAKLVLRPFEARRDQGHYTQIMRYALIQ